MIRLFPFLFLAALVATPAQAHIISGPATIIDGDTIDMTGTRVRLVGIDAPEAKQSCTRNDQSWACGEDATATLVAIVGGQTLICTARGIDMYQRTLASCRTKNYDVGREMVRRGMAIMMDDAPADYQDAVTIAQRNSFGLWSAAFQTPAEWRRANPQASPSVTAHRKAQVAPTARAEPIAERRYTNHWGCAVKGNRSIRGEWIYHLPGQEYYDATRPEELFCTEREAQSAGYRRAKA